MEIEQQPQSVGDLAQLEQALGSTLDCLPIELAVESIATSDEVKSRLLEAGGHNPRVQGIASILDAANNNLSQCLENLNVSVDAILHYAGALGLNLGRGAAEVPVASVNSGVSKPCSRIVQERLGLAYVQLHKLSDGRVVPGDHPDTNIEMFIYDKIFDTVRRKRALEEYLEEAPNRNEEFQPQIDTVRRQLTADFGPENSNKPIYVVSQEQLNELGRITNIPIIEFCEGTVLYDCILLAPSDNSLERYGAAAVVNIGLHEGAHAASNITRTFWTEEAKDGLSSHDITNEGGMIELDPNSGLTTGSFWEEAIVEEYTMRRSSSLGYRNTFNNETVVLDLSGMSVRFTGIENGLPNFDIDTGAITLPWQYVTTSSEAIIDEHGNEDIHIRCNLSIPALGAYGVALLDKHMPGIFDDLLASRTSVEARERAKAKINAIQPGLYDKLASIAYDSESCKSALVEIERALGILEDPATIPDSP